MPCKCHSTTSTLPYRQGETPVPQWLHKVSAAPQEPRRHQRHGPADRSAGAGISRLSAPLLASLRPTHFSASVGTNITDLPSARATFALQPFRKGGFANLCHTWKAGPPFLVFHLSVPSLPPSEACSDRTRAPAQVTSVCLFGQFKVARFHTLSPGLECLWAPAGSLS